MNCEDCKERGIKEPCLIGELNENEKKVFKLLKDDFDNKDLSETSRFTEKQIAKALKMDLNLVKKAVRSLWEKNGHIFNYDGPKFRYRSKTRQHVEAVGDMLMEAKFGIKVKECKVKSSSYDDDLLVK